MQHRKQLAPFLAALAFACGDAPPQAAAPLDYSGPVAEWREWGGTKGGAHYSPLTQIRRDNVQQLQRVWSHQSGDTHPGSATHAPTWLQSTPLVANGTLYYNTPFMRVFALNPETGEERWVFDPGLRESSPAGPYPLSGRGVAYWEARPDAPGYAADAPCNRRILYGTRDSELIALDADTGKPCAGFGAGGRVALREGLGEDLPSWEYYPTSPPLVIGNAVVIGALVADNLRVDAPAGVVRAFDARSGELLWAWDPVPPADAPAESTRKYGRYARGTPNVWSLLSGDAERGLVFVPTGNAAPDAYGGAREGLDYYASSTVALSAATGKVVWHFQAVHKDVWDYDTAAQPQLIQIPTVAGGRAAVIQPTKMGFFFVLDRETGEPLYPVEERPVPSGGVPGESLSPTQPFPTRLPPTHPDVVEPWGFTPLDKYWCAREINKYRWEGPYTPPSLEGSIQSPHTSGGVNWGGLAIHPQSGVAIFNQIELAMVTKLVPREQYAKLDQSNIVYPNESYPMRGTPYGFLRWTLLSPLGAPCTPPPWGTLMAMDLGSGEILWRVPLGSMHGLAPGPVAWWYGDVGVPNFGGGLSTAGGLHFIGATTDKTFRAFNTDTGEVLWQTQLPFAANASPMSFRLRKDGRQFVVVAAGGNVLSEIGDGLHAFALPD